LSNQPIVLLMRFLLELIGLISLGVYGRQTVEGTLRFVPAILLPLIAASIWGIFRVPNDPGPAPIAVSGWLRLMIELLFFSSATLGLYFAGYPTWSALFGIFFILLYAVSYDRVLWLVNKKNL